MPEAPMVEENPNGYAPTSDLREEVKVAGAWKNPNTHAYISRINQREENLFLEEYYSSTDTKIYFDDKEQTEIGYIQYALQEQLKPLYGYTSRTWDDVAIGNRIVTGIFKVPIRNVDVKGYGKDLVNPSLADVSSYNGFFDTFVPAQHNEKENSELAGTEWVSSATPGGSVEGGVVSQPDPDNPSNEDDNGYTPEDPDDILYRQKLQSMGYELGNGDSVISFEEQIKLFQADMAASGYKVDAGSYGKLTSATKQLIDEACDNFWDDKAEITIPKGSKLYNVPSEIGSIIDSLSSTETFVVIQDSLVDSKGRVWKQVMSKDTTSSHSGFYCEEVCTVT